MIFIFHNDICFVCLAHTHITQYWRTIHKAHFGDKFNGRITTMLDSIIQKHTHTAESTFMNILLFLVEALAIVMNIIWKLGKFPISIPYELNLSAFLLLFSVSFCCTTHTQSTKNEIAISDIDIWYCNGPNVNNWSTIVWLELVAHL